MAISDLSSELRLLIRQRAGQRCEYCLLPEAVSLHRHEPDHIVPRQHGGESTADNLALACLRCNRHKGPNIGSFRLNDIDRVAERQVFLSAGLYP